jgi:hypothetical protein
MAVLDTVHPEMFHPRWLKVFNSHLFTEKKEYKELFKEMTLLHRKTNAIPITNVSDRIPVFTELTVTPKVKMIIALWLMHTDQKCLERGGDIPCEYMDRAEQISNHGVAYNKNVNDDFDMSDVNESVSMETIRSPLRKTKKNAPNTTLYAKAFSRFKDLAKICEDNDELWNELISVQDKMLYEFSKKCFEKVGTHEKSSSILSFPEIEQNHKQGRYKSFHEK